jgi:hypothetical protein
LQLDGCAWLKVDGESYQLHCPLGDASSGISIVENIHQWEISDNGYLVLIKVVAELPGYDEYYVEKFLNQRVMDL